MSELSNAEIVALLDKYYNKSLSDREAEILDGWIKESPENESIFNEIFNSPDFIKTIQSSYKAQVSAFEEIRKKTHNFRNDYEISTPKSRLLYFGKRYWMAASFIFLVVSASTYFIIEKKNIPDTQQSNFLPTSRVNDVLPGKDNAILKLSNGSVILLDSSSLGTIAKERGIEVQKNKGSSLSYLPNNSNINVNDPVAYNTIETPRGGKYSVSLSDGTQVWLNSSSSLYYPTVFRGANRVVQLRGEAYFEVAKDKSHPFRVMIGDSSGNKGIVQVLGTHFNIMAYSDEPQIKTTLLEGSVKYELKDKSILLVPGEQARLSANNEVSLVKDVSVQDEIAWKRGYFHFEQADIKEVMRQISRWYNVDVMYQGNLQDRHFQGDIQRSLTMSQVFQILEQNRVHFSLNDKKEIIVSP